MASRTRTPPAWARRLLDWALPVGAKGESIRGEAGASAARFSAFDRT